MFWSRALHRLVEKGYFTFFEMKNVKLEQKEGKMRQYETKNIFALLKCLGDEYYEVNWTFSDSALVNLRMQTFRIKLDDEARIDTPIC